MELSRSAWLLTALLPGSQKFSAHQLKAGDVERLLALLERLREWVKRQSNRAVHVVTIYDPGLDGFWLHRALQGHGIENHVVDAPGRLLPAAATACEVAVGSERDARLAEEPPITPLGMLMALRSTANQPAYELWVECPYRQFTRRRQVAAYGGLAATP